MRTATAVTPDPATWAGRMSVVLSEAKRAGIPDPISFTWLQGTERVQIEVGKQIHLLQWALLLGGVIKPGIGDGHRYTVGDLCEIPVMAFHMAGGHCG
jgi:hypothetical protein